MELDHDSVLRTFILESSEQLSQMEEMLVALEGAPEDDNALQTIFRFAHTLKGNASCLGFEGLAGFAHAAEDLLQRLTNRTVPVTPEIISLLLSSVDALRQIVPDAVAGIEQMRPEHTGLIEKLTAHVPVAGKEQSISESLQEDRRKRPWGRRRKDLQDWFDQARVLRVDIDKLDRMLNLAGELAIARGRLTQMLESGSWKSPEELLEVHLEADLLQLELQELVTKVRMVPVGPVFRQYIRSVRDMARAHDKLARLVLEGEDVEVDTTVIESLRDPLTHMIRNAVDHGLEPPAVRKAAGKDPCGQIVLRAIHEAGSIIIEIEDDGRGFDRDRIIEKARARWPHMDPARLSSEDIYKLVFEPGFSTAEEVSDLSGRGVGMDVVRRNIEALRGTISIESSEGQGSRITIRLPLTLAIIEGFSVGVAGETYVIPLDAVIECLETPQTEGGRLPDRGVMNLRGEALPYIRLRDLLGLGGVPPERESVVVVSYKRGRAGLVVDTLYGERQTVIKPLGRLFHGLRGISGSAILGSGRVALILDIPTLLRGLLDLNGRGSFDGSAEQDRTAVGHQG